MSAKTITRVEEPICVVSTIKGEIRDEQLKRDYYYFLAQKLSKAMLEKGLITADEFNKLAEKNKQKFSPYLAEIMP